MVQRRLNDGRCETEIVLKQKAFSWISIIEHGHLIIPMGGEPPGGPVLSRFLAKIAVESFAERLVNKQNLLNSFIDDAQLDPIRRHAREGSPAEWAVNVRRIYGAHECIIDGVPQGYQTIHESDFLFTERNEVYFVLALFGLEMTINLGGPHVDGYHAWLSEHNNASPLYSGKNAAS